MTNLILMFKRLFAPVFLILYSLSHVNAGKTPDELPSIPWLPDPLMLKNETPIEDLQQWQQQREWIKDQFQAYFLGYMPPIPQEVKAEVLKVTVEDGIRTEQVELHFGPGNKAKMTLELYIPENLEGKLPVMMTQWNHKGWLGVGLRRGYIGCLYAAADVKDDTKNYGELFPEYNFASLMQRAWGATAVVTYLYTRPEVDTDKIALTGHSRNGKASMYAAAFDERIDAVIPSSSGFGGVKPARTCDRQYAIHTMMQTINDFPHWWIPELQAFWGHEDRLPVDFNSLLSLIAPRPCLLNAGIFDLFGDSFGLEASYRSALTVYEFFENPDALQIRQRTVRHNTHERDMEDFYDFLDTQFGLADYPPFHEFYHLYSFEEWLRTNPLESDRIPQMVALENVADPDESFREQVKANTAWLLGEKPPVMRHKTQRDLTYIRKEDNLSTIFRNQETIGTAKRLRVSPYNGMGDQLYADFYYPDTGKKNYPVVIYLHEYAYAEGYGRSSYPGFEMNDYIRDLNEAGYAVLAYDMIGFGTRQAEAVRFYDRYPQWSLMGRMVHDVQSAIDVVYGIPVADTSRIILSGYALGANVAIFASLFDDRVTEIAVLDPFTPFRTTDPTIEGIARFYDYTGLIPRLGYFNEDPMAIPVDLQEMLAATDVPKTIIVNDQSRHIDSQTLFDQLSRAKTYSDLHVLRIPENTHFYGKHRRLLIEQLNSNVKPE